MFTGKVNREYQRREVFLASAFLVLFVAIHGEEKSLLR